MSEILVVGSVAYDTISTPEGRAENTLGGSANYFSLAASLYTQINVVGVVGDDYRKEDFELFSKRPVNLQGLQQVPGKTFHWEGRYEGDMNEAITLDTQLNVFANFNPSLPDIYKSSHFVFLANIDPELQLKVLDQVDKPKFVGSDTMNFWIDSSPENLKKVLRRVDLLLINEKEAQQLTGNRNTIQAAREITGMGPRGVVIKRGEYGFVLYADEQFFILPAFPVPHVIDPTGAGDTFAGGFFGYLAKLDSGWNLQHLKQACIHGCIMASFTVEGFGVDALRHLDWPMVEKRLADYYAVISHR
ncbi:MAG: bifunctional hydroxymethylpyrimidine kinase/phosphomethylpyrimidine kinase [Bdellovibrionales bacterium]|nr:bifunctional hydroxymethylpyrimidine kinase/phosphomethylpyrimidine kinase [Bdellovibrionales bacterium]